MGFGWKLGPQNAIIEHFDSIIDNRFLVRFLALNLEPRPNASASLKTPAKMALLAIPNSSRFQCAQFPKCAQHIQDMLATLANPITCCLTRLFAESKLAMHEHNII